MIRAIRPTDLPLLTRFSKHALANEAFSRHDLTRPGRSLSLRMLVDHWLSLEENRQTWVSIDHRRIDGLISARHEGHAWEIDRLLIPPDADPFVIQRLLSYLSAVGGELAVHRLFLRLRHDSALIDVARGAGFLPYNTETLYARRVGRPISWEPEPATVRLRPKQSADDHALFQLYCAAVPVSVRQAEAMLFEEWQTLVQRGRLALGRREMVAEVDGQIVGWARAIVRNGAGHVEALAHPDHEACLAPLIDGALQRFGSRSPVYCLVGEHEARLGRFLDERGFAAEASFCALVKQLSVRVRQPRLVPAQA
ncbi:MAG: hypothetical protein NZ518_07915 [Dehalococcoidia bacterium]|nr:hypothetical protein [Dehalococcoidia bacterium]